MAKTRTIYRCDACGARSSEVGGPVRELRRVEHAGRRRRAAAESAARTAGPAASAVPLGRRRRDRSGGSRPRASPRSTACSAAGSSPARSRCSAASRASASPRSRCNCLAAIAASGRRGLLVSAEESPQQVQLRAGRLGARRDGVWIVAETALPAILAAVAEVQARPARRRLDSDGLRSRGRFVARLGHAGARVRALVGARGQGVGRADGAGGPRHQRRRAGRTAGARARRRHRAVVRRRPAPRVAAACERRSTGSGRPANSDCSRCATKA